MIKAMMITTSMIKESCAAFTQSVSSLSAPASFPTLSLTTLSLALLALAPSGALAADVFTAQATPYTAAELSVTTAALSPTSIAAAIDKFDASSPRMGHPRLLKGQALTRVTSSRSLRANRLTRPATCRAGWAALNPVPR